MSLKTLPKIYLIHLTNLQEDGAAPSTPTRSRHPSPLRNGFNLTSSRPTTPNVFDFTNGALSNAPVLLPGHNFSTGGPASTAGDSDMTSPGRSPGARDANMASPSRNLNQDDITMASPTRNQPTGDIAMGSPGRSRDEERRDHNAALQAHLLRNEQEQDKLRKEKEEREHEQRKAEAARQHQEMLDNQRRDDLGDFDSDEAPADSAMDTAPTNTSPTDETMDNAPTNTSPTDETMSNTPPAAPQPSPSGSTPGGLFTPMIPYSTQEINLLRSLPGNAEGAYDNEYRAHNYQEPDTYTEYEGPIWYSYPSPTPKPK